jgi:hypothetical protein
MLVLLICGIEAFEMASSGMVDVQNFVKIGSGFQKFYEGNTDSDRQQGDLIITFLIFNKEIGLNR